MAGATVASPSGILSPGYVYATSPASTSWNTSYAGTNIKFEKEEIIGSGVDQRVITTFTVKTGAIADGFSGLAITAAYEEYNVNYTSPSSGTVTTTQVTLNTRNINDGTSAILPSKRSVSDAAPKTARAARLFSGKSISSAATKNGTSKILVTVSLFGRFITSSNKFKLVQISSPTGSQPI